MQFEISDDAAIVFASMFYRRLAAGFPVDASLAGARLAMFAERTDTLEWGTPVLFMRVPDGRLFDLSAVSAIGRGTAQRSTDRTKPRVSEPRGARRSQVPRIFINYRSDDTVGDALHLSERLGQHFGSENVHLADNQASELDWLASAQSRGAFLVLIGAAWTRSLKSATASRHVEDVTRREIEWALRYWPGYVIPVLIETTMPEPQMLPRSLRGLCRKPAAELRHTGFDHDVEDLIARLERIADGDPDLAARAAPRNQGVLTRGSRAPAEKTTGTASGVPAPQNEHFAAVIAGMVEGSVVPVLGSSMRGALPDADQLAEHIATSFDLGHGSYDLAEIAQYVAVTRGERRLYAAMRDVFASESDPTQVHRFLAAFPEILRQADLPPQPQMIICASYDNALEHAFEEVNEPFDYAVYIARRGWFVHFPWGERDAEPSAVTISEPSTYCGFPIHDDGELERTVIVKIHGGPDGQEGAFRWADNYVITEDQYIDYLPTDNITKLIPVQILAKLKSNRCLFLGYTMRDWNARVFLRRVWRGESISEKSWAIESQPDVLEKDSWGLVGHVELLAASLPEYVDELRARLLSMSPTSF
jgi:hypothetical protein